MTRRRVMLATLLVSLAGCRSQPSTDTAQDRAQASATDPASAIERPAVVFAGCRHVEADSGACVLAAGQPGHLHLWIDVHAEAPLEVRVDGLPVPLAPVAVDGGQRLDLELAPTARGIHVDGLAPRWSEAFDLPLAREVEPALVVEATAASRSGDPTQIDAAITALEAALARPTKDPLERLALLRVLHKLAAGRAQAISWAEEAAELAARSGRTRDLADSAAAAAFMHLERDGDFEAARRWVARLEGLDAPEARVWASYYGGVLASRTGDLGAASQAFARARRGAARLHMLRDLLAANEMHAAVLAELGRGDEALLVTHETLASARDPSMPCADRALALGNLAWTLLLLDQAGHPSMPPQPLLLEQLELVGPEGACADADEASWARVNLAYVALADAEPEEAWTWLEGLPEDAPSWLQPWIAEARAQVGLATGRDAWLPAVVRRARPSADLGLRWTGLVREAETLARFGLTDAAEASFLAAEQVLDEAGSRLGIDVGRELFLAGRSASVAGLVERLLARGATAEALCRVRLARGRELRAIDQSARVAGLAPEDRARRRSLLERAVTIRDRLAAEQREDWRFSASQRVHRAQRRVEAEAEADALLDEAVRLIGADTRASRCEDLPAPIPGELTLVPFATESEAWLFAQDQAGVVVVPVDPQDPAKALAIPTLAARVDQAQRLRVLAGGSRWSQSLHALAFADGVLLEVAPLVYALDLPPRDDDGNDGNDGSDGSDDDNRDRLAVVVADPSQDLAQTQVEAEQVATTLARRGWSLRRLAGADATRLQVSQALDGAALLHYAGHGTHGGPSGWQAALVLGDGETLSVSDVLALPRVPPLIVLTGCETASVSAQTLAGGMNLGRAFILAGARWVIAADGEVDDATAQRLGAALYDEFPLTNPLRSIDGAAALRRVQLRLRAEDPGGAWDRFHVLVP